MPQDLSHQPPKTRCRRITTYSNPRIPLFLIWVILISTHLPPSSAAHDHRHHSTPSSRKAVFFKTARSQFHAPAGEGGLYDEDKRLVHTGPNPLHN
ncbi:hypothetical protein L6452_17960 [Arctium lappa]|uniref:Uncharacterized protein n=1 Tax=Arctium lappa TaxID=4217 RepID=A0ACB9C4U9_ARCLA|nr:hypothetical protein L6452_17960 [Arctium lappa]